VVWSAQRATAQDEACVRSGCSADDMDARGCCPQKKEPPAGEDKEPPIASEKSEKSEKAEMVSVPAGEFWMGCHPSDSACGDDEKPGMMMYLDAFEIDKTEVTVSAYQACVNTGKCTPPSTTSEYCSDSSAVSNHWGKAGYEQHPVNCVDWQQADTYCRAQGKQLPTGAQWEKAARGTDGRIYPWGNTSASCDEAVMDQGGNGCGRDSSWRVGSKPAGASPYGALDMSGNVWEWTADWHPNRDNAYRVHRGGGFFNSAAQLRASSFIGDDPESTNEGLGFRCAAPGSI
jgi:formylglycine-generating enzyme required for sulfatase activity